MKANFVWLLVAFSLLISTSSADLMRPKRDLALIQNIIEWLLGINEEKLIHSGSLSENEQQRVYTIPAYQKLLVRTIPRTELNENIRHLLTEGLYPEKSFRQVPVGPIIYNNYYPPAMQDYMSHRTFVLYRDDTPMYPYGSKQPTFRAKALPPCALSVTKLHACYDAHALVTEARDILPPPPMYIQNRMREVVLHPATPIVNVQEDIAIPPPRLRKVDVSEYSVFDDRLTNEALLTENSMKTKELMKTVPFLTLKSKADAEILSRTNDKVMKKKVTFAAPVHTKYKYKMIYHNQPDKNTVVEMDNIYKDTIQYKEDTSTLSVSKIMDQINDTSYLTPTQDKAPTDFIYIPPVNTEMPPIGVSRVNTNVKQANYDNYRADASENIPIMAMADTPFRNGGNKDKPTRVVIRRRKLEKRPENGRGDIPDD